MSKSIDVDTKTFVRFWLVIAVLGILGTFIVRAKTALIIIGIAIFLAVAIWPLMQKINGINKNKEHPGLSAGLSVGGLVLVIGLILGIAGPVVISETSHFISQVPEQISTYNNWDNINQIGRIFGISDAKTQIINGLKDFSQSILDILPQTLVTSVSAIGSFLTAAVLVIVLTILFLTQGPALLDKILEKIDSRNGKASKLAKRISGKIAGVISKYVTGQLTVAILDGIVTGIMVFILSLIFGFSSGLAFPMAMIAMVFYMIPMFGPIITCALVSVLLFFSSPWAGAIFLVFYVVYEQIANNVIAPRIQGNSLDLPPLVILIAITLGMYMFGLIGVIISIPIAGIIKVLVEEYPNIKEISRGK